MSNEREELNINLYTRGIITFAKEEGKRNYGDWLILISHIEEENRIDCEGHIYTHVCKRVDLPFDCEPWVQATSWGYIKGQGFKFYKPTPEEIQIVKDILKRNNKKFVKGINKVIDRIYDG